MLPYAKKLSYSYSPFIHCIPYPIMPPAAAPVTTSKHQEDPERSLLHLIPRANSLGSTDTTAMKASGRRRRPYIRSGKALSYRDWLQQDTPEAFLAGFVRPHRLEQHGQWRSLASDSNKTNPESSCDGSAHPVYESNPDKAKVCQIVQEALDMVADDMDDWFEDTVVPLRD